MDRRRVERWITTYERAWRGPGTEQLGELFTSSVSYSPSPWAEPLDGLVDLAEFWEAQRQGPDEAFTMRAEVLAVELETAVVRVDIDYEDPPRSWRNLWVIEFAAGGRCTHFEEWPFVAGTTRRPRRLDERALHALDVEAAPVAIAHAGHDDGLAGSGEAVGREEGLCPAVLGQRLQVAAR